jgi:hypothetical protein
MQAATGEMENNVKASGRKNSYGHRENRGDPSSVHVLGNQITESSAAAVTLSAGVRWAQTAYGHGLVPHGGSR